MQSRSPSWLLQRCHAVRFTIISPRTRTFATAAQRNAANPELYDVVCVGGGPAGLSLLAGLSMNIILMGLAIANSNGLGASPATSGLKVALIESLDLAKNQVQTSSPTIYSNRCSSLTPASVKYLKGINLQHFMLTTKDC
jgi:ubiquinone biosynthesis monooxygenase Coq6